MADIGQEPGFPRLRPDERIALRRWLTSMRPAGIDTAQDLTRRSWGGPKGSIRGSIKAECVIGVFRKGEDLAAWLLVLHQGAWAIASPAEDVVSARYGSLAEALAALPVVRPR